MLDTNPLFGRQSCYKHEEKKARREFTATEDETPYVEVAVPGVEWDDVLWVPMCHDHGADPLVIRPPDS